MNHEEKANQETKAGQAGEETCALQRGPKEGVGSEEKEITLKIGELEDAIFFEVFAFFDSPSVDDSVMLTEFEARVIAKQIGRAHV